MPASLGAGLDAPTAGEWWKAEGEGFVFLTDMQPKLAESSVNDLAIFNRALADALPADRSSRVPFVIVAFKRGDDFLAYRPKDAAVEYYQHLNSILLSPDWLITVVEPLWANEMVRAWLHGAAFARELVAFEYFPPPWFTQGLPPVLGSFRRAGAGVEWSGPERAGAKWESPKKILPLEQLLRLREHDPEMRKREFADRYRRTSILFTHFIVFGDHAFAPGGLGRYLRALQDTGDPGSSAESAFGCSLSDLDSRFREAVHEKRLKRRSLESFDFTKPRFAPAPATEVETVLAQAALAAGQADTARRHVERLRALGPESALVAEMEGHLARLERDIPRMETVFNKARSLGSRDAGVLLGLARAALSTEGKVLPLAFEAAKKDRSLPDADAARRAADLLQEAIRLRPQWPLAYRILAGLIPCLSEIRETDHRALLEGLKRFPDHPELQFGMAWVERRNGRLAEAVAHMRFSADLADALNYKDVAAIARSSAEAWDLDLGLTTLREAIRRRDFDTAKIVLGQLRAAPGLSDAQSRDLRALASQVAEK